MLRMMIFVLFLPGAALAEESFCADFWAPMTAEGREFFTLEAQGKAVMKAAPEMRPYLAGCFSETRSSLIESMLAACGNGSTIKEQHESVFGVLGASIQYCISFATNAGTVAKETEIKGVQPLAVSGQEGVDGPPVVRSSGSRSVEAVTGSAVVWKNKYVDTGEYSFSIRNGLRTPVRAVSCRVSFYDRFGEPVEADEIDFPGTIPSGEARRVAGKVDGSVQEVSWKEQVRCVPVGGEEHPPAAPANHQGTRGEVATAEEPVLPHDARNPSVPRKVTLDGVEYRTSPTGAWPDVPECYRRGGGWGCVTRR